MTDSSNRTEESKPLAGEVNVYEKPEYIVVKVVLQNPTDSTVTVAFTQSLPRQLPDTHVTFPSRYRGESWTYRDGELRFESSLETEEMVRTAYGVKDIALYELTEAIQDATVTVATGDGHHLGTLTGIQPNVVETASVRRDDTDDKPASGHDDGERPKSETQTTASETEEKMEDNVAENRTDAVTEDETDSTTGREDNLPTGERSHVRDDDGGVGVDETPRAKGDTTPGAEKQQDTQTDESEPDEESFLPANRPEFILQDVRGEIESSEEFDWVSMGPEPEQATSVNRSDESTGTESEASESGLLARIRNWFS